MVVIIQDNMNVVSNSVSRDFISRLFIVKFEPWTS